MEVEPAAWKSSRVSPSIRLSFLRSPLVSLEVVFRDALWLGGSALPGQVKHRSTQAMAAGCVCNILGFVRQVSPARELLRAGMGPS